MFRNNDTGVPQQETPGAIETRQVEAIVPSGNHYLRLLHSFFGKDVFLSYSRADGAAYALALAAQLSERGFACVIDQWGMTTPSLRTPERVRRLLRNCRAFVVVGTRASGESPHVTAEIEEFIRTPGMIIPIDLHGKIREARWWPLIDGLPIAVEAGGADAARPSVHVIERLTNAMTFRRRDEHLRRIAFATALILVLMVAGIGLLGVASHDLASDNASANAALDRSHGELQVISARAEHAAQNLKTTSDELAAQKTALHTASVQAQRANEAASAAQDRARTATKLADQQQQLARHLSAENLLNAARARIGNDPALAARLAGAASHIEPSLKVRDVLVQAAVSGPAWNRFPPFPAAEYNGQLTSRSDQMVLQFASDPGIANVARIDPDQPYRVLILNVDSGRTIRSLRLRPGETIAEAEPLARKLLILQRPTKVGFQIRAFAFEDLVTETPTVNAQLEQVLRSIDCAGGDWPCALLGLDGDLSVMPAHGQAARAVNLGSFPNADRVRIHPSGKSVAVIGNGKIVWTSIVESSGSKRTTLSFNATTGYPYEDTPLPWLRWGPEPHHLLVAEPTDPPVEHRQVEKISLWAIDAAKGSRQRLQDWDMQFNGLAMPVFQTDATAKRVAWSSMVRNSGSRLELVTLDWQPAAGQIVTASRPPNGVLRGAVGSQTEYSVQVASIAPNGSYVVVGADRRGLSGTQFGFGVLESWNLHPLDMKSSLRPESLELPLIGKRHVKRIIYSADSRRIAVLDATAGVTVFKVRNEEGPALQEGLRLQEGLLNRLEAKTVRIDDTSQTWMTDYGDGDRRIYDLATGKETRVPGDARCGTPLTAQRDGPVTTLITTECVLHVKAGQVVRQIRLPFVTASAVINRNLISSIGANKVAFLRITDLRLLGVASLPDLEEITEGFRESGSRFSAPNTSAYFPTLSENSREISFLRLTSTHVLERWSATIPAAGEAIDLHRVWAVSFPKSEWTSVRALPSADTLFALFGDNDPNAKPRLFQVRLQDGIITEHLRMPEVAGRLFEVAAVGQLDADTNYIVFRLYPSRLAVFSWRATGGAPLHSFYLSPTETLSTNDVLGVQPYGDDKLLFVKSGGKQLAYSMRTGHPVWQDRVDLNFPSLPLERVGNAWKITNQAGVKSVVDRIQSGGGETVDAITRIALPPQMLAEILGEGRPTIDK